MGAREISMPPTFRLLNKVQYIYYLAGWQKFESTV